MIFLNCKNEEIVQVSDKTRIDVSGSFFNGDAITDILIKPEASESYISVFNSNQDKWYLDWSYSTSGDKTISVRATDGIITEDQDFSISIISEVDDGLYSNDSQIYAIESELKNYIVNGRNSYKNIHREAQRRILDYLDRKRIWNENGSRISKDQLNIDNDIQRWSLYEAMVIIYEDLVVTVGDKFKEKADQYRALRNDFRTAGALRIDKDKSGKIDANQEIQDLKTFRMIRR